MDNFRPTNSRELLARSEREAKARVKAGQPAQISPATVFNAAKDEATVYVYDAIGGWWGIDPKEWAPAFAAIKAKTIHLRINSPGGAVLDCEAMRTIVAQHPAKVIAHIDGMAASAATGLCIACAEVEMSAGAMFMVHNAWGCCGGNAADMESYADLLRQTTANIVTSYKRRTGKPEATIKAWMDAETWFTATEAKAAGFIDRIFEAGAPADPDKERRERALKLQQLSISTI
jgi:ATP-dependent protease ClpP protease subunit